jgi:aminoglycoside N3'-acetyltransferase
MNNFYNEIKAYLDKINTNILFVHTDISKGFKVEFNGVKNEYISAHIELLLNMHSDLYLPVFNYDFSKSKVFDVVNDISQVGVMNEYFRKKYANWQTPIPFYSIAGTGAIPEYKFTENIHVFDENSIWGHLYKNNSAIMYYGAAFSSSTILHFVEKISNKLCYRYEKQFKGEVILSKDQVVKINLNMHVRPMNYYLDYDWIKIENDLYKNKILVQFKEGLTDIKIVNVKNLVDFWLSKIYEDKLYFLDKKSLSWVSPMLNKLKRPFEQLDFE